MWKKHQHYDNFLKIRFSLASNMVKENHIQVFQIKSEMSFIELSDLSEIKIVIAEIPIENIKSKVEKY